MQIYHTKDSVDIYSVASELGASPIKIAEDNELSPRSVLPRGRELVIIQPTRTYNVRSGDTLDLISRKFCVNKDALKRMNPELMGYERLYPGQLLTVKTEGCNGGMISTNGYFYRGCPRERLSRIMPYLSYVTICSAVYKGAKIHNTFSPIEIISAVKSCGRIPLLRIYLTEIPRREQIQEFVHSAVVLAKSQGFDGITLSSLGSMDVDSSERAELILSLRRGLMEADAILFAEGDAEQDCEYMEYASSGIITYDKLHKKDMPSFEDGEASIMRSFAENAESSRAFIDIPSFAYSGSKYIDKIEAMRIADRRRGELEFDDERKIITARYSKGKKHEIIYESLENTKAKLGLVSELGFLGISFDIGRICLADLMMATTVFEIVNHPMLI